MPRFEKGGAIIRDAHYTHLVALGFMALSFLLRIWSKHPLINVWILLNSI